MTTKRDSTTGGSREVVKYASAHDLRRSFGTRWAKRTMPAVLQKLMRHSSIETTLRYYVDLQADEIADELWRDRERGSVAGQLDVSQPRLSDLADTLGNTPYTPVESKDR